eukprot:7110383-Prorocentrum_lima.AAC.1
MCTSAWESELVFRLLEEQYAHVKSRTHPSLKGQIKGRIAVFDDSIMQTGAKTNTEFLKALEK